MPLGSCIVGGGLVSNLHPSDMYKKSLPNSSPFSATTNSGNRHIVL